MRWLQGGVVALAALCGCQPTGFPASVDATLDEIDRIVDNTDLSPQEKRSRLEALGLSPAVINGLLRDERTGNQFGGDLRSAVGKVVGAQFASLTPDEIQIYADEASAADGPLNVTLSDAQAQAIVSLFADENIQAAVDLDAFLDDPANVAGLPELITEDTLRDVFVDFDPTRLFERL